MSADMRMGRTRGRGEAGFALILAILALMLLTFLGLTLAATSSTELQIATNYRWSQQAYYNAEAGLEAAKVLLAMAAGGGGSWAGIVPTGRAGPFPPGGFPSPGSGTGRDFERQSCDSKGNIGYGLVLVAGTPTIRWENVSTWGGQRLNGAFTIWVRRDIRPDPQGYIEDSIPGPTTLVVTSEGVAPYGGAPDALTRANQAKRVLEIAYSVASGGCFEGYAQEGGSEFGDNYNPCARISSAGLAGAVGAGAAGRVGGAGGLGRK